MRLLARGSRLPDTNKHKQPTPHKLTIEIGNIQLRFNSERHG